MYFVRVKSLLSQDYIYLIPLLASAITGLRAFKSEWAWRFKVFSGFLVITVIVEVVAISWKWGLHQTSFWDFPESNLWIYNAFLTARHLFIAIFFINLLVTPRVRRLLIWSLLPFTVFSMVNYVFLQTPFQVNTYTILLSNSIIVLTVLFFFKQVLDDERAIKLTKSAEIWIALGTLIYYSGTLPFFALFNVLIESNSSLLSPMLYINDGLNVLMYSLYLIAFTCSPQTQK